jgi:hypothetical protein
MFDIGVFMFDKPQKTDVFLLAEQLIQQAVAIISSGLDQAAPVRQGSILCLTASQKAKKQYCRPCLA